MNCPGIIITDICTTRQYAGRGSLSAPQAVVLTALPLSLTEYDLEVGEPIDFAYPTSRPKSVHYAIAFNGAVHQYVEDQNRAWGLAEYHNPTWPLLPNILDVNAPYIFIGFEGTNPTEEQIITAARLVCCIALAYNLTVDRDHVLVARDLDDRQTTLWNVPAGLIAQAQVCVQNGGSNNGEAPMPSCCTDNAAAITTLTGRVTALEGRVTTLEGEVATLRTQVDGLLAWKALLPADLPTQITTLIQEVSYLQSIVNMQQRCIDKMCPPDNICLPIHYTLGPGQEETLTPNIPVWLNLPTKLNDTIPASVLPGPMWTASLRCPCTYRVQIEVQLASSDFCSGKKAWVDMVMCGVIHRVAEFTATATEPQTITLTGWIPVVVPPYCNDLHFFVGTDDVSTPTKQIATADVQMRCM